MYRNGCLVLVLILFFAGMSMIPVSADESKTVYFGTNSTTEGYTIQINNRGGMNYVKFTNVAPIVNRLRIIDVSNNHVMFDEHPSAGITIYLPAGSYTVTGWSGYNTEDANAVTAVFTAAYEESSSSYSGDKSTQTQQYQQQTTVNESYPYDYYMTPGYVYYQSSYYLNRNKYCYPGSNSKGFNPYNNVFNMRQRSVFDAYNPYYRYDNCNQNRSHFKGGQVNIRIR